MTTSSTKNQNTADKFVDDEAVDVVLKAQKEPTLRGDLRDLLKSL